MNKQDQVNLASTKIQEKLAAISTQPQPELTIPNISPLDINFTGNSVARARGVDVTPASQLQADWENMNRIHFRDTYGDEVADQMRQASYEGYNRALASSMGNERTYLQTTGDTAIDVGLGLTNAIGGLGALGLGIVNEDAGRWASERLSDINEFGQGLQSNELGRSQERLQYAMEGISDENARRMAEEIEEGSSPTVAGLRRIGRDFLSTLEQGATDLNTLTSGTGQGIGSMFGAGLVSRGLRAVGAGAAAWPAGVAGTEAGGAYQGQVNEVLAMPFEQLEANSPDFFNLVQENLRSGMNANTAREEARNTIAQRVGLQTAATVAPIAAGLGRLTQWAERPFSSEGLRATARNVFLSEPIEEGLQGGTATALGNLAVQTHADETRQISEGIGGETALGALYGLTSAGAVQTPATLVNVPKTMYTSAMGALLARNERREDAEKEQTVLGDKPMRDASREIQANAENIKANVANAPDLAPEQVNRLTGFIDEVVSDLNPRNIITDDIEFASSEITQLYQEDAARANNTFELMQFIAARIRRDNYQDAALQETDQALLYDLITSFEELALRAPQEIAQLSEDHPARQHVEQIQNWLANINNSVVIDRALQKVSKAVEQNIPTTLTDEEINTPEGQQKVRSAILASSLVPDSVSPEVANTILRHAESGAVRLSPLQKAHLQRSAAHIQALREKLATDAVLGNLTRSDEVSLESIANEVAKRTGAESASQYQLQIAKLMLGGNVGMAQALAQKLLGFVQSQINKVNAYNESWTTGQSVPWDTINPETGEWFSSTEATAGGQGARAKVHKNNVNSIKNAQRIYTDQLYLTTIYNNLTQAFPELGLEPIEPVRLVPEMMRPAEQVVAGTATETQPEQTAQQEPVQEQQQEEVEQPTEPVEELTPVSRITPEQAARLSDEGLNDRLNRLIDLRSQGTATPEDEATFSVLDAEMSNREEAAMVEQQEQPADAVVEDTPVQETESVTEVADESNVTPEPVQEDTVAEPIEQTTEPVQQVDSAFEATRRKINTIYTGLRNKFFGLNPNSKSNLYEHRDNVIGFVTESIQNMDIPSDVKDTYLALLHNDNSAISFNSIKAGLDRALQNFLNTPYSKSNPETFGQRILRGLADHKMRKAKHLILTEVGEDGVIRFKDEGYMDSAILATVQWLVQAPLMANQMSNEDIEKYFGTTIDHLDDGLVESIRQGHSLEDVISGITNRIMFYWGYAYNNTDEGMTRGIAEALAKEITQSLIDQNVIAKINTPPVEIVDFENNPVTGQLEMNTRTVSVVRYITPNMNYDGENTTPVGQYPDLIETIAVKEPEKVFYEESDNIPVQKHILHNPALAITKQQEKTIQKIQKQVHRIDPVSSNFWLGLGKEGLVYLLGGKQANDNMNVNHKRSIEGKNLSVTKAYEKFLSLLDRAEIMAEQQGKSVSEVGFKNKYAYARNQRLMMQGSFNEQASKIMREVLLPTWSEPMDMTNDTHRLWFDQAMAQAFGIKVHHNSLEKNQELVNEKLDVLIGSGLISELANWLQRNGTDLNKDVSAISMSLIQRLEGVFNEAGIEMSAHALHALIEYVRLSELDEQGQQNFVTSLYFEADGVTNGPINAMMLLTTNGFSANFIRNVAKGGVIFGDALAMYQQWEKDSTDLYSQTGVATSIELAELGNRLADTTVSPVFNSAMRVFNTLLGDFEIKPVDGDSVTLVVKRGLTKNPLTVTVYGSGINGIANKIVKGLLDTLYENMSRVSELQALPENQNKSVGELFFAEDIKEVADTKYALLMQDLAAMAENKIIYNKFKDTYELAPANNSFNTNQTVKNFTIDKKSFEVISNNVVHTLAEPMSRAIEQTIGELPTRLITNATALTSIVMKAAYKQALDLENKKRQENDPEWTTSSMISVADRGKIMMNIAKKFGLLTNAKANLLLSKIKPQDYINEISRNFSETLQTKPQIAMPDAAGVSAIPMLVQGFGEAQMIQDVILQGITGILPVFDGINLPLDKMMDYAPKINESALKQWEENNVFEDLSEVIDNFIANTSNAELYELMDYFDKSDIQQFHLSFGSRQEPITNANELVSRAENVKYHLQQKLKQAALSRQAFINTIKGYDMSVDQMAGLGRPTIKDRGLQFESVDALVASMQETYTRELSALSANQKQKDSEQETRQYTAESVSALVSNDYAHRDVYETLSGMQEVSDYVIQIRPENDSVFTEEVNGFIDLDNKIIMVKRSRDMSEVITHELAHAATYEKLATIAARQSTARNKAIMGTMNRLLEQFIGLESVLLTNDSYNDALAEINRLLDAGDRVGAINEMMAWSLTNTELSTALKQITSSPEVLTFRTRLINFLKGILGIPKDSFYDSLKFATDAVIVSKTRPYTPNEVFGIMYHRTMDGNLKEIYKHFSDYTAKFIRNADNELAQHKNIKEANKQADEVDRIVSMVQDAGFALNTEQMMAFKAIVIPFKLGLEIDSTVLNRAQQLFDEVLRTITVEDFVTKPNDDTDRYYAQKKYDVITGTLGSLRDARGASTLLPIFFGLAMTTPEVRRILANRSLPANMSSYSNKIDAAIENFGHNIMENLSKKLVDEQGTNIQTAMDSLVNHMIEQSKEQKTFIDNVGSTLLGTAHKINNKVVGLLETASNKGMELGERIQADNKKYSKQLGAVVTALSGFITEKNGKLVSEGLMSFMNQGNVWEPLRNFMSDLVGHTSSNAALLGMVKPLKSFVQRTRQQYVESLPTILKNKFSKPLTTEQWAMMTNGIAKTDLLALAASMDNDQILSMLTDTTARNKKIQQLKDELRQQYSEDAFNYVEAKSEQLAKFMLTKIPGRFLLKNPESIAKLLGSDFNIVQEPAAETVRAIDQLVTLLSIKNLDREIKNELASIVKDEKEAVSYLISYINGIRKDEMAKMSGRATLNYYKGHINIQPEHGQSLIVRPISETKELTNRGYTFVGTYQESRALKAVNSTVTGQYGYFYSNVTTKAKLRQGLLQNIRPTMFGIDPVTGFSMNNIAGRVISAPVITEINKVIKQDSNNHQALMPVFDSLGTIVAYEKALDPEQLARVETNQNLADLLGSWQGRQVEERMAFEINKSVIDHAQNMYEQGNKDEFVDVLSDKFKKDYPVYANAISVMSKQTRQYITDNYKGKLYIRRDLLRDVVGYRAATVGDIWTGTSNWKPEHLKGAKEFVGTLFGKDTYNYLVRAEEGWQDLVAMARTNIVVRSVIVPVVNAMSTYLQVIANGVGPIEAARAIPRITMEIHRYSESYMQQIQLEADARAATDPRERNRIQARIQAISDSHKRMSIWPLLEAGEFSTIADVGMTSKELELTSGNLSGYIQNKIDSMSDEGMKNLLRYGLITEDTPIFAALQKSVQYGDFIGKAILYENLTKKQGWSKEQALAKITEEFINYDLLAGRGREYAENMGLLWFYNFKVRSAKIAVSMLRNNPVFALFATMMPTPFAGTIGEAGTPIGDNIFTKLAEGSLGYSIGLDQGLNAPSLHPINNLVF